MKKITVEEIKGKRSCLKGPRDHLNGDLPSGPDSSSLTMFLLEREAWISNPHLSSLQDGCALWVLLFASSKQLPNVKQQWHDYSYMKIQTWPIPTGGLKQQCQRHSYTVSLSSLLSNWRYMADNTVKTGICLPLGSGPAKQSALFTMEVCLTPRGENWAAIPKVHSKSFCSTP